MEEAIDALLQVAREDGSLTELSDVEIDGDGSSSLSEIEDKDGDQDEDVEGSDELSVNSDDDENDSEAETERLEESPRKFRQQQDLVMSAHDSSQVYEQSPSKLHQQIGPADMDDDDDDPLSPDDISLNDPDSPKSSERGNPEQEHTTAPTSLGDSAGDGKNLLLLADADTRKRKHSIMAGGAVDDDLDEPLRKRTGSVLNPGDDYAIEDDADPDEEGDLSNPISGNVSGDDEEVAQEDEIPEEVEEAVAAEEDNTEAQNIPISPKKRGRKKKKAVENGVEGHEDPDGDIVVNGQYEVRNGDEGADAEGDDEAEAAIKNEEELEKKRIAIEKLVTIERQFATFRDRLYEERMAQLNREEEMLRQDNPTHPGYLSMMRSITARRDERIRIADKLKEFELENLKIQSVAKRSQILVQYQQEVREIREKKLEHLGQKWYDIQHDRRNHAGSIPDYALKFPARRSQQILNQVAYNSEVSILSGVAKHVGFPAAPPMASATAAEIEDDFPKMSRTREVQQPQPAMPLQELAALRHASSSSRFRPAEEQFMKETPWANPQHPSHAHMIQRQPSNQQVPRTASPFSQVQVQPRRNSHQHGSGLPISGTFSNSSSLLHHSNGVSGGRISPHNPFVNSNHSHTIAPSPLGSRQPSLSPQQNRHPPALRDQQNGQNHAPDPSKNNVNQQPSVGLSEAPSDFPHEARREQVAAMASRF
ncbi:related to DEP1 protein, regulator of phospholipid metabolism [Rhynchosporium agropyri]|uniref:Related to DEP1 protein, regulator of phospholipid metabolism n=1 Tax=Rhynchosporium agropyri TaxID=914238 RepID=A0A1E1JU46_9HELO|nr:related to DEP1 protein, regulator of phospholipid metabolism [Rhynchosporium agropyri]